MHGDTFLSGQLYFNRTLCQVCHQCGMMLYTDILFSTKSAAYQPAGTQALRELQRSLRRQARTLLRRAAEHLETHAAEFPEYDPHKNILNRCTTDGNFVQTR